VGPCTPQGPYRKCLRNKFQLHI